MKVLQVVIIVFVLWFGEVESYVANCTSIENGDCYNTISRETYDCLRCTVNDVESSGVNDVLTISPAERNHSYVGTVWFVSGNVTALPVIQIENKIKEVSHICLLETNTKAIDAGFFKDEAEKLQEFTSIENALTIGEDSFVKATNLVIIIIINGKITKIPSKTFFGLKKLQDLSFKDNELTHIDPIWFTDLQNLELFNVQHNKIKFLETETFDKLINMMQLYLNNNEIETLPKDLFKHNVKLTHISLENNKIKHIGIGVFGGLNKLTFLDLEENQCVNNYYLNATAILSYVDKDLASCYSGCKWNPLIHTVV